jgi:hypothetical protein
MVKGVPIREIKNKSHEDLLGELKRLRVKIIYNQRKNYKILDLLKFQVLLLLKLPKLK